jgi:hypothetical protein
MLANHITNSHFLRFLPSTCTAARQLLSTSINTSSGSGSLPKEVTIYEVGARDGLQNEKGVIDTSVKVELINRLSDAGLKQIEATSFVSPKWVPQLADAADVMANINRKPGVSYSVLTPNMKVRPHDLQAPVLLVFPLFSTPGSKAVLINLLVLIQSCQVDTYIICSDGPTG